MNNEIIAAIRNVERLMNEAKAQGIAVSFNIPETEIMAGSPPVCVRKEYRAIVQIDGKVVAA